MTSNGSAQPQLIHIVGQVSFTVGQPSSMVAHHRCRFIVSAHAVLTNDTAMICHHPLYDGRHMHMCTSGVGILLPTGHLNMNHPRQLAASVSW